MEDQIHMGSVVKADNIGQRDLAVDPTALLTV